MLTRSVNAIKAMPYKPTAPPALLSVKSATAGRSDAIVYSIDRYKEKYTYTKHNITTDGLPQNKPSKYIPTRYTVI